MGQELSDIADPTASRARDAAPAAPDLDRPRLSVVVVSYNTRELTLRCLESVLAHPPEGGLEVFLVDNASADGSVEAVRARFPGVRVIANAHNRGFAAANNQAFERARGEFVLLLNPDTEVEAGALEAALEFIESRPRAGVVGCRVLLADGAQQSTVFRYLRLSTVFLNLFVPAAWMRRSRWLGRSRYIGLDLDRVQDVEVVAGCFMLVPRRVLAEVGGMDEGYFMYGEEADWCHRITRAGWSVLYYPDATIVHIGGQSAKQRPEKMLRAMARSQLLFLEKSRGKATAYAANVLMLLRDLPRAALHGLLRLLPGLRDGAFARRLAPASARVAFHLRGLVRPDWRAEPVPIAERRSRD